MKWRATDLIDFEYFLRSRSEAAEDGGEDRAIYRAYTTEYQKTGSRRELFRYWLCQKRRTTGAASGQAPLLPGAAAAEALGLLLFAAAAAGFFLGAGVCGSLLAYAGEEPINVFTCLWVMLAPQLLLLMLLCGAAVFRRFTRHPPLAGIYPLLSAGFRKSANKLAASRRTDMGAEKKQAMAAALGLIGQSRTVYGSVVFRPIFILGQVFGVCFNIGLAGVLILRVTITDLAFGWQSTLQPAAETIHALVRALALPWSWALPPSAAHPTAAQIEGSRFVFKEGMRHLESPDLTAWWLFLLLCVIVYGLLPRFLLLTGTMLRQKRDLQRLSFSHAACDRLLMAMQTPRVQTRSRGYERAADPSGGKPAVADDTGLQQPPAGSAAPQADAIVLVPEEIAELCEDTELQEVLHKRLGLGLSSCIACRMETETDLAAIKNTSAKGQTPVSGDLSFTEPEEMRLLLIQEAWQPPIRELLSWIAAVRQSVPGASGLIIGLIGKPRGSRILTPPADTDRMIWEQALARLQDPYIRVEILGG